MTPFHLKLYEAIRNDELKSFDQSLDGYFPRDQDGNPVLISDASDDCNVTIGYIQHRKRKAIKVWEKADPARASKYATAAQIIKQHPSRFLRPFEFREKYFNLNGQALDILITDWINHDTLKIYLSRCLGQAERLHAIAAEYAQLQQELQQHGLAQYFWSPESIIVTSDAKLLIDDHSFCMAMQGSKSNAFLYDNYAATLCTYISIKAFAAKPHLWDRYLVSSRRELLLRNDDLTNLTQSAIYLSLKGVSAEIDRLLEMLVNYCDKNVRSEWLSATTETRQPVLPVQSKPKPENSELIPASAPAPNNNATKDQVPDIAVRQVSAATTTKVPVEKKLVIITDCSLYEHALASPTNTSGPRLKLYGLTACAISLLIFIGHLLNNKLAVAENRQTVAIINTTLLPEKHQVPVQQPISKPIAEQTNVIVQNDTTVAKTQSTPPLRAATKADDAAKISTILNSQKTVAVLPSVAINVRTHKFRIGKTPQ